MKKLLLTVLTAILCSGAFAQTMMPIPAQSGTFSGNVRGYYFTAPTCFTITGVRVPTDASSGDQSIAIVRLQALPPFYSTTTNVFTTLFLTQNNPNTGILPVNIQVEQGDVIGILGQRATVCSYGVSNFATTIDGFPVTIARLGMQYNLTTTPPQELWTEAGGSISRVEMYYTPGISFTAGHTVLNPSDVEFTNNADSSFTSVWDYGDSSPLNTIDGTHTHTYALAGTYNACNYITTSCGTDTICMSVTVCGSAATSAGYSSTTMGAMAMFTDASTNATSWYWDFGDSNTSTSQSPSHTYAASGTYYVCLTAYNGICDTATFCDSVTICLPASATYTFFDSSGTVQFTDSSVNVDTWVWDFGDASPPDSNQNPVHTYTVNGTYTVCLVASSCSADTTCNTITVCPEALTAAFMSSDSGTTAMFTDMSATATSWLWDFGDGNFSTSQNPTNVYANTGLYTVCLTTWNICGDSAMSCDTILLIITGQEALNANVNIGVYPNPMNDATTITVTSAEHSGNYVFEMYDAAGKLVRTQNGAFNQSMNVNRGDLSNGMYFYKIKTNNEVLGNGKIMLTN